MDNQHNIFMKLMTYVQDTYLLYGQPTQYLYEVELCTGHLSAIRTDNTIFIFMKLMNYVQDTYLLYGQTTQYLYEVNEVNYSRL